MRGLAELLREPTLAGVDLDAGDRLAAHARVLNSKRMLRAVFVGFHQDFDRLDRRWLSGEGARVEIGSGVAPIRDSFPDVLATDVVPGAGLDRILDAEDMDLADASVRVIFGQNCFHHFPHPERFFAELERVLCPGGGAILLEPYHGPLATFLFKRLFDSEGFDKEFPSWQTPLAGPMRGANQALSYIVFERDRAEFERCFPRLRIVHEETCSNQFAYLMSGGLNFRQLWPDWLAPPLAAVERLLSPFGRWLALHHIVVLRKEA